mgnify:CR=1 FL=1|jgi:hypothetical protein
MADDLKNIRLAANASSVADSILESGIFEDKIAVAKFALAYAIKNFFNEIDPEYLDHIYDSNGSNYNIGSIDEDQFLSQMILAIYPQTTTPYRYVRVLMDFGLDKLGDKLREGTLYPISKIMI